MQHNNCKGGGGGGTEYKKDQSDLSIRLLYNLNDWITLPYR